MIMRELEFINLTGATHCTEYGEDVHIAEWGSSDIITFKELMYKNIGAACELNTGDNRVAEFWSKENLAALSYCEGDVYVIFYNSDTEFTEGKSRSEAFYRKY